MAPVVHLVMLAYKEGATLREIQDTNYEFVQLKDKCLHPDTGKTYVLSVTAGKHRSNLTTSQGGMTHAFIMEFASQEDLDYYNQKDPVHLDFAGRIGEVVARGAILDIEPGKL